MRGFRLIIVVAVLGLVMSACGNDSLSDQFDDELTVQFPSDSALSGGDVTLEDLLAGNVGGNDLESVKT